MKLTLWIIPALLVLSTGCTTSQSIDDTNYETVIPEQVEVVEKQESSVTFNMSSSCGSACWANLQELINQNENTFEIKTIAEVTSEICTEQCVPYKREYTIEIPAPGDYTFQFIHRDSVYQSLNLSFP
ncbi:MAG: hypothetical protein U5K71_02485 [Gracilimonas sp.]|nr:hypothetical protein [Gracilimonas sp.]